MAKANEDSGKGLVIALVIFIILAFAGIGTSIWLYQQMSIVKQATLANQKAFQTNVAKQFEEQNWELPRKTKPNFGIKFNSDSYKTVAEKLKKAVDIETMAPKLGWSRPEGVTQALNQFQPPDTDLSTVKALLKYYSKEHSKLNEKIAELNEKLKHQQDLLADRKNELSKLQKKLTREKKKILTDKKQSLNELNSQYNEMEKMYQKARSNVQNLQDKLSKAKNQWQKQEKNLKKEIATWQEMYKKATREEKPTPKMKPDGKILSVDLQYDFVIVPGGKDIARKPDTELLIYRQSPEGKREIKAKATLSKIHETTSMALITSQKEQPNSGDLFVTKEKWEAYQTTKGKNQEKQNKNSISLENSEEVTQAS